MGFTRAAWADRPDLRLITIDMISEDILPQSCKLPLHLLTQHSSRIAREYNEPPASPEPMEAFTLCGYDSVVFHLFLSFCLDGRVHSQVAGSLPSQADVLEELSTLVQAWELGNWLESTTFKDAVVDTMHRVMSEHRVEASRFDGREACAMVGEMSGMARLLIDHIIWQWDRPGMRCMLREIQNSGSQLSVCLAARLEEERARDEDEDRPFLSAETCYYHEHGDEDRCYRTVVRR